MRSSPTGMLTLAELAALVGEGRIDTVVVLFTDLYGRPMGKRFDAELFTEQTAKKGTHACDYLLTVDMEMTPVPGYELANWERGYGDVHLVPDLSTLRWADWLDRTALVVCDVHHRTGHARVEAAPRSLLQAQIERVRQAGYEAMGASELEYYSFQQSYREAASRGWRCLEPTGWYLEDYHILQGSRMEALHGAARRHLKRSGVPVECTKGEWGLGQHELNIRYYDVQGMADRHVVVKQCLKEIADAQGLSVTFMAKYAADGAGSSCHVHLSLWQSGENSFAGERTFGPVQCSDTFRWFLGGWMAHVPELMVFYAPTVNSYKRFQAGSWAPTRLAWSHDNRTAGFRIVGQGESLRIECRIPGADCSPYLVYAAALASGMDGIARRTEPPEIFDGDVYQAEEVPHVPRSLTQAISLFEQNDFVTETFGPDVVEHYAHFFKTEQQAYDMAVTDWERQRYFERI